MNARTKTPPASMAIPAHSRKREYPEKKPSLAGKYNWIAPFDRKPRKRIKDDDDFSSDQRGQIWVNPLNSNLCKVVVKAVKTADLTARLNQGVDVVMVCATSQM